MNELIIIVMLLLVISICLNIALYKKLVDLEKTKTKEIVDKIEERTFAKDELKERIEFIQDKMWGEFKKV